MEKEPASFWAEIKKYEDMLAKDPRSYCFAPLSELYRKLGLLDDAVNVAKRGIEIHPDYVGGYMALGRAYFEKGIKEECQAALERVVKATPDNFLAQKLLSQIYIEQGDDVSAEKALQVLVLLNPDEVEGKLMLEALGRTAAKRNESGHIETDEAVTKTEGSDLKFSDFGDGDISEGPDVIEDPSEVKAVEPQTINDTFGSGPLATATLAELYIEQGFFERAEEVYKELLEADPDNSELKRRYDNLQQRVGDDEAVREKATPVEYVDSDDIINDENHMLSQIDGDEFLSKDMPESKAIAILEGWLANIGRRRDVH
jgi:tetratricopeptide (TPR) repeat protein